MTEVELISAYKDCFRGTNGKVVLKHLIKMHGVFHTEFEEESPYATSFNAGGKNAVIQILRKLHTNEDALEEALMMQGEDYVYEDGI